MLTEIPRLLRRVQYINPSDTNRIIDLHRFDVIHQFDRFYVLADLIKSHIEYQAPPRENSININMPLPRLVDEHRSCINNLEQANKSSIIKLNKPLNTTDINWEVVLKSNILEYNITDFVFNMGTQKGWLNPSVQEHVKNIYLTHNIPPWIVDNNLQVPENLSNAMVGWRHSTQIPYRYPLFVHGPKLLYNFDTNDQSFTNYAELMRIDNIATTINKRLSLLHRDCILLSNILAVEYKINKAGGVENLVKNMDLKTLLYMCFPVNTLDRQVIKSLIEATLEVSGGKEYMTNRYNHAELSDTVDNVFKRFVDRNYMGDPNDIKIVESIINHPSVDKYYWNVLFRYMFTFFI
jgi:hypothetical protein